MKKIILLLILLAACASKEADLSAYKCPDCNVILISIDTFRGDHLTCAGYNKYDVDITKNICAFASEGILFTRVIAQASSTQLSHASIFTATIPSHHQSYNTRNTSISNKTITLAEVLKKNNYETGGFTAGVQVSRVFGFSRGFDTYQDDADKTFKKTEKFRVTASKGMEWIRQRNKPFFLFLHTYEIHHPYTPNETYAEQLDPDYNGTFGINISLDITKFNKNTSNLSKEDLDHIIAMYDAEIMSADDGIGWFISELKRENLLEKTIIVLTSDHGEEFGEHGRVAIHSWTLYNELLHVPLILYAPGLKPGVKTHMVRSIDIAPTILSILGIPLPETFSHTSLFDNQSFAISERETTDTRDFTVQSADTKYFNYNISVFDLVRDPLEQNNIIGQHPEIKDQYTQVYDETLKKIQSSSAKTVQVPKELREQLKALGYIA